MFYVYGIFSTNRMKIKEIDAGRYVGWERHSVRFQHITLIQEILATT
jgi:hypothetical protein